MRGFFIGIYAMGSNGIMMRACIKGLLRSRRGQNLSRTRLDKVISSKKCLAGVILEFCVGK